MSRADLVRLCVWERAALEVEAIAGGRPIAEPLDWDGVMAASVAEKLKKEQERVVEFSKSELLAYWQGVARPRPTWWQRLKRWIGRKR